MKFLNVTNHALTEEQKDEARRRYDCRDEDFLDMPEGLKALWSQIPTDVEEHPFLFEFLDPVIQWIRGKQNAVALVQGESIATFVVVVYAQLAGIPCVAAVSRRETVEENGKKTSVFRHCGFRQYPQCRLF